MTPKEFLQQYGQMNREINRLLDERQHWLDLAVRITPSYSDSPKAAGTEDKIVTAIERIVSLEERINRKIDELIELKDRIEAVIQQLPEGRQREILWRRYVMGQKWEQIALEMHLDYRWVLRLHGRALQRLHID